MSKTTKLDVTKMLSDCKPFLKRNIDQLDQLALYRATKRDLPNYFKKIPPRSRTRVKNSKILHYFYNKKTGKDRIHNAYSAVSGSTSKWFRAFESKVVFPVGNDYTLSWCPGAHDFGKIVKSNNYMNITQIKGKIERAIHEMEEEDSDDFKDMLNLAYHVKRVLNISNIAKIGRDPMAIEEICWNELTELLYMNLTSLERKSISHLTNLSYNLDLMEDKVEKFVKNEVTSKVLKKSAKNAEVLVRAPQGVYYAVPRILDKIIEKIKNKS